MAARKPKPAPVAASDGPVLVEGVWPEVFTGIGEPDRVLQFEKIALAADVAQSLIDAGAVRLVAPAV